LSERVESGGRKRKKHFGVRVRNMLKDVTYKNIFFFWEREIETKKESVLFKDINFAIA